MAKIREKNPYYWVTTFRKYRDENLSEEKYTEFFNEGGGYVNNLFKIIRRRIDPSFEPERVLDSGCGAGRMTIPLAEIVKDVVGMDISESMLEEARKNGAEKELSNLSFVKSDDRLSSFRGTFSFIHPIYVFQHIPWSRGKKWSYPMMQLNAYNLNRVIDILVAGGSTFDTRKSGATTVSSLSRKSRSRKRLGLLT